jgi:hypothetical protein
MEVSWASEHGLPHSALLEWDDEDRAKLTAYLLESNAKCQMCGTADWEWEEDRFAYEPAQKQCWGCYTKEISREGSNTLPGSTITLVPKLHVEKMKNQPKKAPGLKE